MAEPLYPLTVPKWGIEMQEGTIVAWHVADGAAVGKGDELVDIETDKIVNTLEAPIAGTVRRRLVDEGDTLDVGALIGVIATAQASDTEIEEFIAGYVPADARFGVDDDTPTGSPPPRAEPAGEPDTAASVRASPVAKRLAKKLGIDLAAVTGTGRNGRISKDDVEAAAAAATGGGDTIQPWSARRSAIARRMLAATRTIPHFYLTRRVAMTQALERKGDGVSLNAVLLAATAAALKEQPKFNVHVHDTGVEVLQGIDINIAVDTADGLLAPLLRGVDALSPAALTEAIAALAERARAGRLDEDDRAAGGFTVSNLGALGIESFTAIINPPQAAILAVGRIEQRPSFRDGELVAVPSLRLTLSCDHRAVDGGDGARFLDTLALHLGEA